MKDLKLFVWEEVLTDYTSGIAFALARDVEDARFQILTKFRKKLGHTSRYLEEELAEEPKIVSSQEGFYIFGGG